MILIAPVEVGREFENGDIGRGRLRYDVLDEAVEQFGAILDGELRVRA